MHWFLLEAEPGWLQVCPLPHFSSLKQIRELIPSLGRTYLSKEAKGCFGKYLRVFSLLVFAASLQFVWKLNDIRNTNAAPIHKRKIYNVSKWTWSRFGGSPNFLCRAKKFRVWFSSAKRQQISIHSSMNGFHDKGLWLCLARFPARIRRSCTSRAWNCLSSVALQVAFSRIPVPSYRVRFTSLQWTVAEVSRSHSVMDPKECSLDGSKFN